jgi:opacity protein-like surface antigen
MKTLTRLLLAVLAAGAITGAAAQEGGTPAGSPGNGLNNRLSNRIMVDGMYRRNLGEFGETWGSATGVYASYGIAFPDHNLLVFRTGYVSSKLADGVEYPDAKLDIVPLHVGGRYYFTAGRVMPFASFMTGIDVISENTSLDGTKAEKTHAKFAWELGAGATVNVAGPFAIDLSANYQSDFYTHEAMATGFSYTAGLAWNFGE